MQFHHHGYVSGDPRIKNAAGTGVDRPAYPPDTFDVLIVGAGPAGMITAAQLSRFAGVSTRLIDSRSQRMAWANADGVAARSVETFQAFGFANDIIEEAYEIAEMAIWRPDPENPGNIVRESVPADATENISEFPHLIINQVRIQDKFVEYMRNSPTRMAPEYGIELVGFERDNKTEYPIKVHLRHVSGEHMGRERIVRVKCLVGCDGAHSTVRHTLGYKMKGFQSAQAWGVLDVLVETDFPDYRRKCIIQSKSHGNIMLIPREGGYFSRIYVDMGPVETEQDSLRLQKTPVEDIIARTNAILHPYTLTPRNIVRHTIYEVGHRVANQFDDASKTDGLTPRVFIEGDACHNHSAKAGQGMNVSMQDGFNLGWKLGYVLECKSSAALLETYSEERQQIAQDLIDFDSTWQNIVATSENEYEDASELEDFYIKTWEFPAGFMTEYKPSLITGEPTYQALAAGYPMGKRFWSAPVRRVCDGTRQQLGHLAEADGRFRIYVFADRKAGTQDSELLEQWSEYAIDSAQSPLNRHVSGHVFSSMFDIKVIFQQAHGDMTVYDAPEVFRPRVGPYGLMNYEQVFAVDPEADIFDLRGISREDGAVIIARPDQYVGHILPLQATRELADYFAGFML